MAGNALGAEKAAAKRLGLTADQYRHRIANGQKFCWKCRSWKLREQFGVDQARSDGLDAACFQCRRVRVRANRKLLPFAQRGVPKAETAKARMREAHAGERNHRWKDGTSADKRAKRDPLTILARRAVNHAIEAGRLAKPSSLPCLDCGKPAKEYDHHRGYDRAHWLDVQAVCVTCHHRRTAVNT